MTKHSGKHLKRRLGQHNLDLIAEKIAELSRKSKRTKDEDELLRTYESILNAHH